MMCPRMNDPIAMRIFRVSTFVGFAKQIFSKTLHFPVHTGGGVIWVHRADTSVRTAGAGQAQNGLACIVVVTR